MEACAHVHFSVHIEMQFERRLPPCHASRVPRDNTGASRDASSGKRALPEGGHTRDEIRTDVRRQWYHQVHTGCAVESGSASARFNAASHAS